MAKSHAAWFGSPLIAVGLVVAGMAAADTPLAGTEGVDRSVRPGDDFYRYANNAWLGATRLPDGASRIDTSAQLRAENARRVRALHISAHGRARRFESLDIRARTSITLAGSDAVHQDPDYSGAYVFLSTDGPHEGVGMTFTIGRGNDLCCSAIEQLAPLIVGRDLEELVADGAAFWRIESTPLKTKSSQYTRAILWIRRRC